MYRRIKGKEKLMETYKTISHNKYKEPYPTLGDIVKGKNYDYVDYRIRLDKEKCEEDTPDYLFEEDIFAGAFKVENGEIISLDGDNYYKEEAVLESEEWVQKKDDNKITHGLTVIVSGII